MKLNEKIKDLRLTNNLTQEDLAQKLNISRQSISKYEQGLNEPSIGTLKQMAFIFNISIEELIGDEKKPLTKKEKRKSASNITFLLVITLTFLSILISLVMLRIMKDIIPVHFNEFGQITRYGSKYESLVLAGCNLLFMSLAIGVYLYTKKNPEYSSNVLITNIAMITIISTFIIANLWWGYSNPKDIKNDLLPSLYSILFALLTVLFIFISPKINKQNFVIGFRTPYTLENVKAWNKANNVLSITGFLTNLVSFILSLIFFKPWSIHLVNLMSLNILITYIYYKNLKKEA